MFLKTLPPIFQKCLYFHLLSNDLFILLFMPFNSHKLWPIYSNRHDTGFKTLLKLYTHWQVINLVYHHKGQNNSHLSSNALLTAMFPLLYRSKLGSWWSKCPGPGCFTEERPLSRRLDNGNPEDGPQQMDAQHTFSIGLYWVDRFILEKVFLEISSLWTYYITFLLQPEANWQPLP